MRIGVLFFEDAEELDAIGPWEVLSFWAKHVAAGEVTVVPVGLQTGPVRCAHGLSVNVETTVGEGGPFDVLVYPGGPGARALVDDADHIAWVRGLRAQVPLLTSVCTGALVYAAAGLLADRPATTHWRALDTLAEIEPTADVRRDARVVDDGDLVTSAGISAGIDMALHLVARLGSEEEATAVRRGIQYEAPTTAEAIR